MAESLIRSHLVYHKDFPDYFLGLAQLDSWKCPVIRTSQTKMDFFRPEHQKWCIIHLYTGDSCVSFQKLNSVINSAREKGLVADPIPSPKNGVPRISIFAFHDCHF